jgi:DNA-binding NarL/FixJ family response regulator
MGGTQPPYFFTEQTMTEISKPAGKLSEREKQVLKLLTEGKSNEEAAQALGIGKRTVEAHRARLMLRLGIHDLANLVKYAIKNKITTIE